MIPSYPLSELNHRPVLKAGELVDELVFANPLPSPLQIGPALRGVRAGGRSQVVQEQGPRDRGRELDVREALAYAPAGADGKGAEGAVRQRDVALRDNRSAR